MLSRLAARAFELTDVEPANYWIAGKIRMSKYVSMAFKEGGAVDAAPSCAGIPSGDGDVPGRSRIRIAPAICKIRKDHRTFACSS